ncbi:thermonuclease family protein [Gemmatimonadota bacterium]
MSRILFLITLALAQSPIVGTVEQVIDGDTIRVRLGDRIETVRYIGVDTPETVHPRREIEPYGLAASAFNRTLVEGQQIRLEQDVEARDRYGRLLAYVYTDSLFVNAELIRQGYAQVMTVPPNVRHADMFVRLQRGARRADRGLWGIEAYASVGIHPDLAGEVTDVSTGIDASTVDDTGIVYITRTGTKYHRAECHHLRHSRKPITLAVARERDYSACSVCKPPRFPLTWGHRLR